MFWVVNFYKNLVRIDNIQSNGKPLTNLCGNISLCYRIQSFSRSFMTVIENIFQTFLPYIQSEWAQTSPFGGDGWRNFHSLCSFNRSMPKGHDSELMKRHERKGTLSTKTGLSIEAIFDVNWFQSSKLSNLFYYTATTKIHFNNS